MKLRIQGSSLRLRLKQGEVATLAAAGRVTDRLVLGPGRSLTYGLETAEVPAVAVRQRADELIVQLPRDEASNWCHSDRVGVEADLEVGDGHILKVLIQKDFACLHQRAGEDESDSYHHPAAG